MSSHIEQLIRRYTDAVDASYQQTLQSLWSGYGSIDRYLVHDGASHSVIVKHVRLPENRVHPRGWHGEFSHQRKLRSYEVETLWYQQYAARCGSNCRVPGVYAVERIDDEVIMILEDLDDSGFPLRKTTIDPESLHSCLNWLAAFHASFMRQVPEGLWPIGTYWHLDTRPDEFDAMPAGRLKDKAREIDRLLQNTRYPSFVHGDAKLANFCFSANESRVAAVDFQYVGGGCGMKDVAYFISSCLDDRQCALLQEQLLDMYFECLRSHLQACQPDIDAAAVEADWRPLYAVAWADFVRFLQGWSPDHWKIHGYSQQTTEQVLRTLEATA